MLRSASKPSSFVADYARFLTSCAGANYSDNHDSRRFGPASSSLTLRERVATRFRNLFRRFGVVRIPWVQNTLAEGFKLINPHLGHLEWLYERLRDEDSRNCLIQVIAYRALGERRVKLPLNTSHHWELIDRIEKLSNGAETLDPGFNGWPLSKINLSDFGFPIEMFFRPVGIVTQFFHQQYRCDSGEGLIEPNPGDWVVDAGGCWGDTALYFASKVGEQGKVSSFEFIPENLNIFRANLALNPSLASRIRVIQNPVWSSSGQKLYVEGSGPGTTVRTESNNPDAKCVLTVTLDQLMEQGELERVDFIKMDIEGAELPALQGAKAVLTRFRPKLAITVYHSLEDFWQIPEYLDSLNLGYRFYLRHFTIHEEETVLFAQVGSSGS